LTSIEAYAAPETVEDAAKLAADGTATIFAGGTDLMPQTKAGAKVFSQTLLNLRRVEGMRGAIEERGEIRIGALTTVTDVLKNELLRAAAPVLCDAADKFASGQIRNSATIGGNICNASPAADMIIPLLLLGAEVELVSWVDDEANWRLIPLKNFFKGPGQSKLRKNEILKAVKFRTPQTDFVAGFVKFGTRPALDISVVSVGIGGQLNSGVLTNARVAFGAVAPVPMRGLETEAVIEGKKIDDKIIKAAASKAAAEVAPIDDVRASAWYRRELIQTLTGRLLRDVVQTGD
jgi:CO/xanthine dehydrogenase FAD-binding subunit